MECNSKLQHNHYSQRPEELGEPALHLIGHGYGGALLAEAAKRLSLYTTQFVISTICYNSLHISYTYNILYNKDYIYIYICILS